MSSVVITVILALPFLGALLLLFVPADQRKLSGWLAGIFTLGACVLLLLTATTVFDGTIIRWRVEWLPSLGVAFGLRIDGLAMLFGLLILGIGLLIVVYSAYYLSPTDSSPRFFCYLLVFMGAMLGVVLADNLILLAVFWELTSLSSFLLIGFWRHREDARQGARMALAVTGLGGLA
ncbi:MAG: proton-conducting transporter membrane subunit, partial [Burkholderiales bacterium]